MNEQINATVRQSSHDPTKNTTIIPVVADIPEVDIITSRTDASLYNQQIYSVFY